METALQLHITIKPGKSLSAEEWREVDRVSEAAYADETGDYTWSDEHDWVVMGSLNGQIVSCLIIIERTGRVGEAPVRLGGVGGVATHPDAQRKGYAAQVMLATGDFLRDRLGVEFGLLVCSRSVADYYARLGWQTVKGPLLADQPDGKTQLDLIDMMLPCASSVWPAATWTCAGCPGNLELRCPFR